jgi:hypothetical protein
MSGAMIQQRVWKGYRKAAAKLGFPHQHYRPFGPESPLAPVSFLGEVLAVMDARPGYNFNRPAQHDDAFRYALVDGAAVQVADYLVGPQETVFVAGLPALQPLVCIACNAILTMRRASAEDDFGSVDAPPGPMETGAERVMWTGWPASMLHSGLIGGDETALPGDAPPAAFMVLMPRVPDVDPPRAGDVVTDERNRRFAVVWHEAAHLGWRMLVRHLAAG